MRIENKYGKQQQGISDYLEYGNFFLVIKNSQKKRDDRIDVEQDSHRRRIDSLQSIQIQEQRNDCEHHCNDQDIEVKRNLGWDFAPVQWVEGQQD